MSEGLELKQMISELQERLRGFPDVWESRE